MNFVPLFWIVAVLTLLAEVAAVCIVNLVTASALRAIQVVNKVAQAEA